MSSTRSIIAPPPFAANALTVIPPTPVAGVSYRDPFAGPASSPDGWPYAERVNSAEFNQILYQLSSMISIQDKKGLLGWSDMVDYTEAAICFGSDGAVYEWLASSGPNNGGAKDPTASPAFWKLAFSGRLLAVQRFTANGTYTPTPGVKTLRVTVLGGGGGGGGSGATGAGQQSIGCGGSAGGYAVGLITSGIVATTITVGAAGAASAPGFSAGGNGGSSGFGGIIFAGGGQGGNAGVAVGSFPNITAASSAPGVGSGGSLINAAGGQGGSGINMSSINGVSGYGGASAFGGGAIASSAAGIAAVSPGSGGSGALSGPNIAGGRAGGAGAAGLVIVEEFS